MHETIPLSRVMFPVLVNPCSMNAEMYCGICQPCSIYIGFVSSNIQTVFFPNVELSVTGWGPLSDIWQ
jgi:hypothetical protein